MNSTGSTRFAGGKINLRLKVTGKRQDGYHELDTIFYPFAFPADKITIDSVGTLGTELVCSQYIPGDSSRNLALLAAQRYAAETGIAARWRITLEKVLPIAAGFGGGSSDAAAVLKMLNDHFQLLDDTSLAEIALSLGADVPFFLKNSPVRATGIGEVFENFALPEKMPELLLVYPGFPVSAKWAYQNLAPENIGGGVPVTPADYISAFSDPGNADWDELVRNDLAFALWEKFPVLRLLKRFILDRGAWCVQISGSGSGMFALFGDPDAAGECAGALRKSVYGNPCTRIFTKGKEW